jgi:hypothetical protein
VTHRRTGIVGDGAKHTMPEPVYALVGRARPVAPRSQAHPLEITHVDTALPPEQALDHAVIASGREHRRALRDHGGVVAGLDGAPAERVGELMAFAEKQAVTGGGGAE